MGSCENLSEMSCGEPRMGVDGGAGEEELVSEVVGEGLNECAVESPVIGAGGAEELVDEAVGERLNECAVESSVIVAGGAEELVDEVVGDRLDECAVESPVIVAGGAEELVDEAVDERLNECTVKSPVIVAGGSEELVVEAVDERSNDCVVKSPVIVAGGAEELVEEAVDERLNECAVKSPVVVAGGAEELVDEAVDERLNECAVKLPVIVAGGAEELVDEDVDERLNECAVKSPVIVAGGAEELVVEAADERSNEFVVKSPLVVAGVAEELVSDGVGERLSECVPEPSSSLDICLRAMGRERDDTYVQSVSETKCSLDSGHGLGTLVVEGGNLTEGCSVPADGAEEVLSDHLGGRLQELVVVPLSSSNISSQVPRDGEDPTVQPITEQDSCLDLDHGQGTMKANDGNLLDGCPSTADAERNSYHITITEKPDLICGRSDDNAEPLNVLSIESGLSKISFQGMQWQSKMNPCLTNYAGEYQLPSEIQPVAGACNRFIAQHVPDIDAGGDNTCLGSLVEVTSDGKHVEDADDGPSMILVMPDKLIPNDVVTALNFGHDVEGSINENNDGNGNARTDDDVLELKCPDTPLSLRRSSRSRKTVQQVQKGKSAAKCSKKASKSSLCRNSDLLSEAIRKKRSCSSRLVCSSGWGLPGNLSKFFEWSNDVTVNQASDEGARKRQAGQRSKKKNMNKVATSSQFSEEREGVSCRPIRLKVTFGKKEEHNKVEGMSPAGIAAIAGVQPSNGHTQLDLSSYVESTGGIVMDNLTTKEMPELVRCSTSLSNVQFRETNIEICSMSGKSSHSDSFQLERDKLSNVYADKCLDPGTSPDSEVIDQVLDSTGGPIAPTTLHNSVNSNSYGIAGSRGVKPSTSSKSSKNKRNKDKHCYGSNAGIILGIECQRSFGKAKELKKGGQRQKINDNFSTNEINAPSEIPSCNTSGSELVSMELLAVADEGTQKAQSVDNGADSNISSRTAVGIESADSGNSIQLLLPVDTHGKRNQKGLKSKGKSKSKSKIIDAKRNRREPSAQRRGSKKKLASKCEVRETGILDKAHKEGPQSGTGNHEVVYVGESDTSKAVVPENILCPAILPTEVGEQILAPRVAWVCCDECHKWRCISAELADAIEATNSRWTCEDNQNQAFADCSIPQEKSNAEINAELQISDEEDARDWHFGSKSSGIRHPGDLEQSTWMIVKSNLFLHRSRKTQTMDEIMVCHCKPADGSLSCGSQCLNRMLNIECVHGTCPCGDLCSNQQFQRRQYAKLSWFRSGKKGYGLQVLEDISEGKFLIEYVGEVLDLPSYEARQKDYALKGHKHFYFMTLNGNEVIDACTKGNLGRFVNHSCDPNCRTEKWVVNGEICVGLFALRNIKKGEELTFDYNYVRVFGAAAKKCYCGSFKCRGYIGGDPLNAEVVVQGDSDEEFPEPVLVDENGEIDHSLENMLAESSTQEAEQGTKEDNIHAQILEPTIEVGDIVIRIEDSTINVGTQLLTLTGKEPIDEVPDCSNSLEALQTEDVRTETVSAAQQTISTTDIIMSTSTSSPKPDASPVKKPFLKCLPGLVESTGGMSEVNIAEGERPHIKARPRMKISRPSKLVKTRKFNNNSTSDEKALLITQAQKSQSIPSKAKKLLEGSANGHLEGVEEKLNELLDAVGGICKKKDASKGYLKLLLLTAASGDSGNGGAIQSNRELSMILDAMLKTKSRGVLLDVINKNGLQMLHNMLKLYRRDFKKTPILRKLLKVLEFLAEKEILTVERIVGDPLRPGVESFRESILSLTEHDDRTVHQIARNFRDRWIPRPIRKFNGLDKREFGRGSNCSRYFGTYHHWRDHGARTPEAIDNVNQAIGENHPAEARMQEAASSQLTDIQTIVSRPRKRKSRWDQPADPISLRRRKEQRIEPTSPHTAKTSTSPGFDEGGERLVIEVQLRGENCDKTDDVMQNSDDDAPPGFSSPQNSEDAPPGFSSPLHVQTLGPLDCPSVVSMGLLQERFNPRLPVAYGIPSSVIKQFGTLQSGTVDSWAVAPAIPFQPFPPLPPYPRDKRARLHSSPDESVMTMGGREEVRQENHLHADAHRCQGMPSTSGANVPHVQNSCTANHNVSNHARGSWNGPGRRYYRQKKWNSPMLRPPWLRNLDGRGFKGNHARNRPFDRTMETIANEQNGQLLADVNHSVECAGNSC